MAAIILKPIAYLINITSVPFHPLFPVPLALLLHAARVSFIFRHRTAGKNIPWAQELVSYLTMCWGGGFLTAFLLGLPVPQLLSVYPFVAYSLTHMFLSTFPLPSIKFLDTIFPLIDAVTRSGSIIASISLASAHPNLAVSSSLFLQAILGAIASSGGMITALTLGVTEEEWRFSTPPILRRGGTSLIASLEIWSGALAGLAFGALTGVESLGWKKGYMTFVGARSVVVAALTVLYYIKTSVVHYSGPSTHGTPGRVDTPKRGRGRPKKEVTEEKKKQ